MKKIISALISRTFLLVITLIATIFFSYVVYQLQILPTKYFVPLVIILVLICLLLYVSQNDPEGEHLLRVSLMKIMNVALAVALAFASLATLKGSDFLSSITGASTQTIEMNVAVLKSSTSYQSLEDLEGCDFGGNEQDSVNVNKTEAMIEDEIGDIDVITYSSYTKLVEALENYEVPAIIIKAVDIDSLDDIDEGFSDKINIIATFTITIATVSANSANVTSEAFNIFICGTDKEGSIDTFGLSDVNMIVTVNPTTKQILIISIPRDYYVEIIGMDNVSGYDKLTHSAKGGISCTMETLENLLDIDFNYYAKFNFTSFTNVIDALGGITIDVPQYEVVGNDEGYFTTKIGNYTIYPGENTFDADEALAFVRERKSFIDGDSVRSQNQMLMLKAIIKKICSTSLITNMDEIFESLSDCFETNMSDKEIKSLINMQIDDGASWDIQTYHMTGSDIRTFELATVGNVSSVNASGLYVTEPSEESVALASSYIEAVMNDEIIKLDTDDEDE